MSKAKECWAERNLDQSFIDFITSYACLGDMLAHRENDPAYSATNIVLGGILNNTGGYGQQFYAASIKQQYETYFYELGMQGLTEKYLAVLEAEYELLRQDTIKARDPEWRRSAAKQAKEALKGFKKMDGINENLFTEETRER